MKTIFHSILFSFLAPSILAEEGWQFLLDQEHLSGGGFSRKEVSREGSMTSDLAVPLGGSVFTLWAKEDRGSKPPLWHKVGEDTVGAYLPDGSLSIQTPDPYSGGIPRTRVDQGFTLNVGVSGLLAQASDKPEAAQKVLFDHRVAMTTLQEGQTSPQLDEADSSLFFQGFITKNGSEQQQHLGNLPGDDLYSEAGLETFTLFALPDGVVASKEIAKAQVQIWPLAKASISGINAHSTHRELPEIKIDLVNLYPDSETYTQIYPGPVLIGTEGTKVLDSLLVVNDIEPRNSSLLLDNLGKYLTQPGTWTLEVLTTTPFGTERLNYIEFNIEEGIKIRGSINALK